jgi:hypothetical protein
VNDYALPRSQPTQASLIKQAFAALVINEAKGATFEPDAQGRGMTDGQQVCVTCCVAR